MTDEYDRRVVSTYLEEYFGDWIFSTHSRFAFFEDGTVSYTIPPADTKESFIQNIESLPLSNSPAVFGLHPDAEIGYLASTVRLMWSKLISLQPNSIEGVGSVSREDFLESMATDILNTIPLEFDIFVIKKQMTSPSPTQIVLLQELDRWNALTNCIQDSLRDIKRAVKGEIGMSQKLDQLANSLMNGTIPVLWTPLAPGTQKNLASWLKYCAKRWMQYDSWIKEGEPKVIWLSGLHIPEAYITALVQATCRKNGWPLDKSTLYTEVTHFTDVKQVRESPTSGCYVSGLYLQGAAWDMKSKSLQRVENGGKMLQELPILRIIPIESHALKLANTFKTPVYTTDQRRNAGGHGWVFDADLHSQTHSSHWTLEGVALLLNDAL